MHSRIKGSKAHLEYKDLDYFIICYKNMDCYIPKLCYIKLLCKNKYLKIPNFIYVNKIPFNSPIKVAKIIGTMFNACFFIYLKYSTCFHDILKTLSFKHIKKN
jgi:hypothetical protein